MKPSIKALVAAATVAFAFPLSVAEFTLLIHETPLELAKRTRASDAAAYWESYNQFAGQLIEAGVLRGGSALSEADAVRVRGKPGGDRTANGARLGGYFVIDVANLDEAKKWAAMAPAAAVGVEVWAHRPNPTTAAVPAMSAK